MPFPRHLQTRELAQLNDLAVTESEIAEHVQMECPRTQQTLSTRSLQLAVEAVHPSQCQLPIYLGELASLKQRTER